MDKKDIVVRTLDLTPERGEMLKPAETIDIIGTAALTLRDRQIWNELIDNAFGPALGERFKEFKITISKLRPDRNSNERVEDSIERLMKTVVRLKTATGTRRFQLLGGNDMGESGREHGILRYNFDPRLAEILQESKMFGKLEKKVIWAFSSKYAVALYEYLSRTVRLRHVFSKEVTVEEMRDILGVDPNQLKAFGNFKQKAIEPAVVEVNALAPFSVKVGTKRTGRKITHIALAWSWKDPEGRAAALAEIECSKVGRKERIKGTAEDVFDLDVAAKELVTGMPGAL